eukprot:764691-Hanusia_phi.AAC.2
MDRDPRLPTSDMTVHEVAKVHGDSGSVDGWKQEEESEEDLDEEEKLDDTILKLSAYITIVASHLLSNSRYDAP